MTDEAKPAPVAAVTESPMHRLRIGDHVSFEDVRGGQWPPDHLEGEITGFANDVGSYLTIDFGDAGTAELTEDEVRRVS